MPEDEKPAFLDKEKLELLLTMIRDFQDKTNVIITKFSVKTPIVIHGFIMETELTMDVHPS